MRLIKSATLAVLIMAFAALLVFIAVAPIALGLEPFLVFAWFGVIGLVMFTGIIYLGIDE